jgi:hypothetical protein
MEVDNEFGTDKTRPNEQAYRQRKCESSLKIPIGTHIAYNQTNKNVTDKQTDKHKDSENLTII